MNEDGLPTPFVGIGCTAVGTWRASERCIILSDPIFTPRTPATQLAPTHPRAHNYTGNARRTDLVCDVFRADLRRDARGLGHRHQKRSVQRVGVQVPCLASVLPLRHRYRCYHFQHCWLGEPELRRAMGVGKLHRIVTVRSALALARGVFRAGRYHARGVLHESVRNARGDDSGQHVAPGRGGLSLLGNLGLLIGIKGVPILSLWFGGEIKIRDLLW